MKIQYFALLRNATGKHSEDWAKPAATLRVLMQDLIKQYGPEFERWVSKDGEISSLAIILVDGQDVRGKLGLDTPLTPQSEVFIFPPVAGG